MKFKEQVRADLTNIKVNLAEHMARTEALESHVFSWKYKILMHTSVVGAILGIVKAILSLHQ